MESSQSVFGNLFETNKISAPFVGFQALGQHILPKKNELEYHGNAHDINQKLTNTKIKTLNIPMPTPLSSSVSSLANIDEMFLNELDHSKQNDNANLFEEICNNNNHIDKNIINNINSDTIQSLWDNNGNHANEIDVLSTFDSILHTPILRPFSLSETNTLMNEKDLTLLNELSLCSAATSNNGSRKSSHDATKFIERYCTIPGQVTPPVNVPATIPEVKEPVVDEQDIDEKLIHEQIQDIIKMYYGPLTSPSVSTNNALGLKSIAGIPKKTTPKKSFKPPTVSINNVRKRRNTRKSKKQTEIEPYSPMRTSTLLHHYPYPTVSPYQKPIALPLPNSKFLDVMHSPSRNHLSAPNSIHSQTPLTVPLGISTSKSLISPVIEGNPMFLSSCSSTNLMSPEYNSLRLNFGGNSGAIATGHKLQFPIYTIPGTVSGYLCPFCKKDTHNASGYRKHLLVHLNSTIFPCGLCEQTFDKRELLERHHRVFHAKTSHPFPCLYCDKHFQNNDSLKQHILGEHSNSS